MATIGIVKYNGQKYFAGEDIARDFYRGALLLRKWAQDPEMAGASAPDIYSALAIAAEKSADYFQK